VIVVYFQYIFLIASRTRARVFCVCVCVSDGGDGTNEQNIIDSSAGVNLFIIFAELIGTSRHDDRPFTNALPVHIRANLITINNCYL